MRRSRVAGLPEVGGVKVMSQIRSPDCTLAADHVSFPESSSNICGSGPRRVLLAGAVPGLARRAATATQTPASHFELPPTEPSEIALPLPEDRGQADLEQTLKRLGTTASVLMIVAHPDDEDGALLTYLSRGMGARATLFTLTRGEGGQNAMTADTYDALGLIRTNELLKANEYNGAKQLWGTEADFGFSKTQAESFAQLGTRPRSLRRRARRAPGQAAGHRGHIPRRRLRRPRAAPGLRRNRAGGLQSGRRSQGLSRAAQRRPCSPGSRWPCTRAPRSRASPARASSTTPPASGRPRASTTTSPANGQPALPRPMRPSPSEHGIRCWAAPTRRLRARAGASRRRRTAAPIPR